MAWLEAEANLTLEQLKDHCRQRLGVKGAASTLWYHLQELKLSFKKSLPAAEEEREDVKKVREQSKEQQKQWDANTLVFIDESGLNTQMTLLYGWAAKSQRCVDKGPHGHWHC